MRHLFIAMLITFFSFSCLIGNAEAKRFGGGKSFGMSRSQSSYSRSSNNTTNARPAAPQPAASGASKWLGPLAGLAAGGLLASLFMGHGFGSGILSWIMVLALAWIAWRFLQNRMATPAPEVRRPLPQNLSSFSAPNASQEKSVINEAEFLRQAKTTFIRLQAAYDNKNLPDIREFTSPEMFAEIQMQLQERGNEHNQTEVISLEAELLDYLNEAQNTLATVQFSASIREEQNPPANVKEIWHFRKNVFNANWVVAGIEQVL